MEAPRPNTMAKAPTRSAGRGANRNSSRSKAGPSGHAPSKTQRESHKRSSAIPMSPQPERTDNPPHGRSARTRTLAHAAKLERDARRHAPIGAPPKPSAQSNTTANLRDTAKRAHRGVAPHTDRPAPDVERPSAAALRLTAGEDVLLGQAAGSPSPHGHATNRAAAPRKQRDWSLRRALLDYSATTIEVHPDQAEGVSVLHLQTEDARLYNTCHPAAYFERAGALRHLIQRLILAQASTVIDWFGQGHRVEYAYNAMVQHVRRNMPRNAVLVDDVGLN